MKKLVLLGTIALFAFSTQAGLYRWIDEAGNVHFSDKVPASASQKAHSKLNKSGTVTKSIDPQSEINKSNELALKKEQIQKENLLIEIKQEALLVVKKRDDGLLSTYENKEELTHSFNSKVQLLHGSAKIIEAQNVVLSKKIDRLKRQKSSLKAKNRIKSIDVKIVDINATIDQYKLALIENNQQVLMLTANYEKDLARYIQLTE